MIPGLQRSCHSLQNESLIFTVPISLHGALLTVQNKWRGFFFFFSGVGIMYSRQPSAFLEAVFMYSVKEREAVTEKFCGFPFPFLQPVLNYGLSAQQGEVKFSECQQEQLCLAG